MSRVRIRLLGDVCIAAGPGYRPEPVPRSVRPLLAFLVLQPGRLHSRPALIEQLWQSDDIERSLSRLSTALWRMRRLLAPMGAQAIRVETGGALGIARDFTYWLDADALSRRARACLDRPWTAPCPSADRLERAVAAYSGDLLEDEDSDWAVRERERLRNLHLDSLEWLAHYRAEHGQSARALHLARRLLDLDPLREGAHRLVMRLHLRGGDRAAALRQYERCRAVIAAELDIPPMPETEALRRTAMVESVAAALPAPTAAALRQAETALDAARDRLRAGDAKLAEGLHLVRRARQP